MRLQSEKDEKCMETTDVSQSFLLDNDNSGIASLKSSFILKQMKVLLQYGIEQKKYVFKTNFFVYLKGDRVNLGVTSPFEGCQVFLVERFEYICGGVSLKRYYCDC